MEVDEMKLWHLSDGRGNWITCVPISESDAIVSGGKWYCHEIVRLPHPHTWETAARPGSGRLAVGDPPATPVTPFDVEIVFDVLTGYCADPKYAGWPDVGNDAVLARCYRAWLEGVAQRAQHEAA